jgi:hypothetical protein
VNGKTAAALGEAGVVSLMDSGATPLTSTMNNGNKKPGSFVNCQVVFHLVKSG